MKKISKILISSIIPIFCCLLFSPSIKAEEINDDIFLIQENACAAHEQLYNSFEWDKTYIYPDDFGGDYIDYDTLHVLVTNSDSIPYYETLLSNYKDNVVFDVVSYSYNYLFDKTEDYVEKIDEDCSVVSYGVDVINNKGKIEIMSNDNASATENKPYSLSDESDSLISFETVDEYYCGEKASYISIETSEPVSDTSLGNSKAAYTVAAGSGIVCDSVSSQVFTLGGSGTCGDYTAFVTCGHNTSQYNYISYNGSNIGYITICQKNNKEYGDYSIIRAGVNYTSTSAVLTSGQNKNFTGSLSNPAVGTYLYKYGDSTGQAYCVVDETNKTVHPDTNIYIYGMTKAKRVGSTPNDAKGNSGGPYRYNTSFCGVHHGYSTSGNDTYFYFTPYVYLYNAGFRIETS